MSQYLQQNSQRFFSTTYQYTAVQGNNILQQSQRNPMIRDSSLNRNNSIGSSMTLKSGKIQDNFAGKIKRDSKIRNSMDFKENDPYTKNSIFTGHINKIGGNLRDSMEVVSQYDSKNSYCNPLIMKRERNSHEISRQNLIPNQCTANKDNLSQNIQKNIQNRSIEGISQHQYDSLNQRIVRLQSLMKDNGTILMLHSSKLQKLQELCSNTSSQHHIKSDSTSKQLTRTRHSRSINSNLSATPSFKQLSEIMNLIQESKNYQMKNAQQYRKMIGQFRSTLLEFRQELNKTVKRADIEGELAKLREIVAVAGNGSISNGNSSNNGNSLLSRKSSFTQKSQLKPSENKQTLQKIQSQITSLKLTIQKLEQTSMSLKADLVKSNVREKKFCQQVNESLLEVNKKLVCLGKEIVPFNINEMRRGNRHQGTAICFRVSQQLISCPIPKPPMLSKSTHIPSSSSSSPQHNSTNKQSSPTSSNSIRNSHDNTSSSIGSSSSSSTSPSSSSQMLTINTKTYYIDKQGYLLDKDNYYLLNQKNQQIKLSQKEISMLRKLKVIE